MHWENVQPRGSVAVPSPGFRQVSDKPFKKRTRRSTRAARRSPGGTRSV